MAEYCYPKCSNEECLKLFLYVECHYVKRCYAERRDAILDQLLFILNTYFLFFTKQASLSRRPTVLILPIQ